MLRGCTFPLGHLTRRGALIGLLPALLLGPTTLALPANGSPPPRPAVPTSDAPHFRWREGPVRYIITSDEDLEFKQLSSDEARARFIERFWSRRDREARTMINEYRLEFWERVATTNRLFADSSKPGWKTDMGRYYILLGPPDDRDTSLEMAPGLGRTGIRGAITWRYSHSPTAGVGTGLTLVFTRDGSGEYRVTTDPAVLQYALSGGATLIAQGPGAFGIPLPELPPRLTELQLLLDLGRLEQVPTEEDLLTAIVTAEEFFGVIPFTARYDFFAGLGGKTLVAVTLSLHPDPFEPTRRLSEPDYLLVGRIDAEEPREGVRPLFLRELDFSPGNHNADPGYRGPYIYQAVTSLSPGRHKVSFAAFDRTTRKTGSYGDALDVPAYSQDRLSLSSLCLSESIQPVPVGLQQPAPYVFGNLKVIPRLLPLYRNGETFAVYYQIYSAGTDPTTQAADMRIEYQFYVEQGGGYVPIGQPIRFESVGNSAQGWSFPLRDWPTADFRLRVTVSDSLTGQITSRDVTFKVM